MAVRRPRRRQVQLMFGNGGGGHKASSAAVHKVLSSHPMAEMLEVQLVDASAIAGAGAGDWLYNVLLSFNAVSAIKVLHSALHTVVFPLVLPSLRQRFRAHFAKTPDLDCVVSFVPILNAVMADTLPAPAELLTVLTDFSHTESHPWIQHPRQHVIAGTDVAVAQALASGYAISPAPSPSMRVTPTSGMVVHSRFYSNPSPPVRRRRRAELGFPPDLPVVLILFGGTPPTDRVLQLVDLFLDRKPPAAVNVIAICARNRALYDRLSRKGQYQTQRRLFVTGFTDDIPLFMQISDVLIGKPGPGVVSEAFVSALPVVLVTGDSEAHVMQQEYDVLTWVRSERIGLVVRSAKDAAKVSLTQIEQMRRRIAEMPLNRAVFEVRDLILETLGLTTISSAHVKDLDAVVDMADEPLTETESEDQLPGEVDLGDLVLDVSSTSPTIRRELMKETVVENHARSAT